MSILGTALSLLLIVLVLVDGFETILQPRRVVHRYRFVQLYYANLWALWRAVAVCIRRGSLRGAFLSIFGPLSILGLFSTWLAGLIVGFALLHWCIGSAVHAPDSSPGFQTYLYLSGTTFFTLGYGDITPAATLGRILAVIEAGLGFGFLAIVVSYLPVLFQAFSHREVEISLLDARAGSPPSAAQMLLRVARSGGQDSLSATLRDWERWAAELLESHLSFPVLSYFRSQHDNQSWLATLTTILDTCAILIAEVKGADRYQAQLTFAMARHAAVDLTLVLKTPVRSAQEDRLPPGQLQRLCQLLREAGVELHGSDAAAGRIAELRGMYEPFLISLGDQFLLSVPPVLAETAAADNWQKSAWMGRTPGIGDLPPAEGSGEGHF